MNDHARYEQDAGAFVLGALEPAEQAAFEGHLAGCADCRAEVERLRVAAEALPRAVEPFAPPPSLKRALMQQVREDARPTREPLLSRLGLDRLLRPQLALAGAAALLAVVAIVVGTQGGAGHGRHVVAVGVRGAPSATATVTIAHGSGQLRVTGMPPPQDGKVYEIWLKRGDQVEPGPLFNTDDSGNGVGAIPGDLTGVNAVLVTREKTGGAKKPTSAPIISARI